MIIDCHGHYTTAPAAHTAWREAQRGAVQGGHDVPPYPKISDDEIRESVESSQLRLMAERGVDLTVFSPRASAMGHHFGDEAVSAAWTRARNDLIARVTGLYPDCFAGVGQLPQSPGVPIARAVTELRRCVTELGFVGCNLNPDPSGGHWTAPPLTDRPQLVPVLRSHGGAGRAGHGARVRGDQPQLPCHRLALPQRRHHGVHAVPPGGSVHRLSRPAVHHPHGGGAVPYHWGRFRGLADMLGRPPLEESVLGNVFFDTCVYHQPGIDLLFAVIRAGNILFGSEMVGAVRGIDPRTGRYFDDTRQYVDALELSPADRRTVYEGNARRVFPRLDARLRGRGQA